MMFYIFNISKTILICLSILILAGCKKPQIEPTCEESVPVVIHHGEEVRETYSGLYIKKNHLTVSGCSSRTPSDTSAERRYVTTLMEYYYWVNSKALDSKEMAALNLNTSQYPRILFFSTAIDATPHKKYPSWWHESGIPHQKYPIQLLVNFGLKEKSQPKNGKLLQNDIPAWAIAGTISPITGMPFVTSCSIKAPPYSKTKSHEYERDPLWLTKGEADETAKIGSTCRGYITDTRGRIDGMIDVPGSALVDIDKIYRAVSEKLTDALVD